MLTSTEKFIALLEEKNIKYNVSDKMESGEDWMDVTFKGEAMETIRIQFIFDTDEQSVALRVFDIATIPENKKQVMLEAINKVNNQYRFAKFCLAEDNTIQMEADCIFRQNEVGAICEEYLYRCVNICDDAYPILMKALWG